MNVMNFIAKNLARMKLSVKQYLCTSATDSTASTSSISANLAPSFSSRQAQNRHLGRGDQDDTPSDRISLLLSNNEDLSIPTLEPLTLSIATREMSPKEPDRHLKHRAPIITRRQQPAGEALRPEPSPTSSPPLNVASWAGILPGMLLKTPAPPPPSAPYHCPLRSVKDTIIDVPDLPCLKLEETNRLGRCNPPTRHPTLKLRRRPIRSPTSS